MGGHPPHGKGTGGVPLTVGAASDGVDTTSENRQEVGVHTGSYGKGICGVPDDGGVHSAKAENGHAVHCYAIASGPV